MANAGLRHQPNPSGHPNMQLPGQQPNSIRGFQPLVLQREYSQANYTEPPFPYNGAYVRICDSLIVYGWLREQLLNAILDSEEQFARFDRGLDCIVPPPAPVSILAEMEFFPAVKKIYLQVQDRIAQVFGPYPISGLVDSMAALRATGEASTSSKVNASADANNTNRHASAQHFGSAPPVERPEDCGSEPAVHRWSTEAVRARFVERPHICGSEPPTEKLVRR